MAVESVGRFFQKLEEDNALHDAFGVAVEAAIGKAVIDVAKKHGFKFNAKELGEYLESQRSELNEQDLDGVSAAGAPEGSGGGRAASLLSSMFGSRGGGAPTGRVHVDYSPSGH